MPPATSSEPSKPVQVFRPTSGTVIGWIGVAVAAVAAALTAATEPNVTGVRAVLGTALLALVIWVVLLRPRAAAYSETLVLRNQLSDVHLPLARIDSVVVRQTLNVWVGDERYVCAGIGRSTRNLLNTRGRGTMAVIGVDQTNPRAGVAPEGEPAGTVDYATFVETRITDLARSARRDLRDRVPPPVRRVWARRELVALAALGVAFVVSLLV
jgi:hypothetical protein